MTVTPLTSPLATSSTENLSAPRISEAREAELRESASQFEAAFVRQMLDYAGLAEAFGAGEGQSSEAFSSFLLDHLATEIAETGSFGLAETFYERLASLETSTPPGKRV